MSTWEIDWSTSSRGTEIIEADSRESAEEKFLELYYLDALKSARDDFDFDTILIRKDAK